MLKFHKVTVGGSYSIFTFNLSYQSILISNLLKYETYIFLKTTTLRGPLWISLEKFILILKIIIIKAIL